MDELAETLSIIERDRLFLQEKSSLLADINTRFNLTQQALEEEKKGLFDHMVNSTNLRNHVSNIQSYLQELEKRSDRNREELSQVEKETEVIISRRVAQEEKIEQMKELCRG